MSISKTISDLQNNSQEIFDLCKQNQGPIFLQDNENEELVIMSREYYERMRKLLNMFNEKRKYTDNLEKQTFHVNDVYELYQKLDEADTAILNNEFHSHSSVIEKLRNQLDGPEKKSF